MAKKTYCIRIVINDTDAPPLATLLPMTFLESLRYAGIVRMHLKEDGQCFDLHCPNPKQTDSKAWAEANAARMRSFGYNAVCAPEWLD